MEDSELFIFRESLSKNKYLTRKRFRTVALKNLLIKLKMFIFKLILSYLN